MVKYTAWYIKRVCKTFLIDGEIDILKTKWHLIIQLHVNINLTVKIKTKPENLWKKHFNIIIVIISGDNVIFIFLLINFCIFYIIYNEYTLIFYQRM